MTDDEVFRTTNENIEHATPEALQELAELVVARAVTRDRALASVEWTPPGAPFFAEQAASFWRPRRALEPLYRSRRRVGVVRGLRSGRRHERPRRSW